MPSSECMMRPVLVLGTEPRVAFSIARSLQSHGIEVDILSLSPDTPRLSSRAIRKFFTLPQPANGSDKDLFEALMALICKEGYDMLIPSNDSSLAAISEHYEELRQVLHVGCPSPEIVARVLEKDLTLDVARRLDIEVPKRFEVEDLTALKALRERLTFPVVAKGRSKRDIATSTFKVRYYKAFDELAAEFETDPDFGRMNLLQEYCPGEGVGIGILIHKAELVAAFQHRRLKEFPSTGGVSVLAISELLDPDLLRDSLRLLRALEWEGIAMVEFRYDRTERKAVLMEVNGRYWGTVSMALLCGIDFPLYEWQLAHGEAPQVPETYPIGVKWRWTAGYVQRLHSLFADPPANGVVKKSRLKELVQSSRELTTSARSAMWSSTDPRPAWSEFSRTVKRLAIADTKSVIRRLVPPELIKRVSTYRNLQGEIASSYLKLQLQRAAGLRGNNPPGRHEPVRSVLFVCHGNIIRSPMAAALLRHFLAECGQGEISVMSAGLAAKAGRSADARAIVAAREFGVSLDDHRAQLLSRELVDDSDLVFVMDYVNEAKLLLKYPGAKSKVFLLSPAPEARSMEVQDPYEGNADDIRRCYADLGSRIGLLGPMLLSTVSIEETA
jgi:protein-tyrosine-phosphatase/predicted ATP-grasp superfamily ATP-dependent carboligase